MANKLVLYSTNTWLAYRISERYYNDEHYVWCTPYFDPRRSSFNVAAEPPSSSPFEMYRSLSQDVIRGDRHSAKIQENRAGIRRGASVKRQQGVISEAQENEINSIVHLAQHADFRPLMFVIPYSPLVANRLSDVSPEDKAHPLSAEYIIECLPRASFDIIEFGDVI